MTGSLDSILDCDLAVSPSLISGLLSTVTPGLNSQSCMLREQEAKLMLISMMSRVMLLFLCVVFILIWGWLPLIQYGSLFQAQFLVFQIAYLFG